MVGQLLHRVSDVAGPLVVRHLTDSHISPFCLPMPERSARRAAAGAALWGVFGVGAWIFATGLIVLRALRSRDWRTSGPTFWRRWEDALMR